MAMLLKRGEVWYVVYWRKDEQGKWKKIFRATKERDEAAARKMFEAFEAAQQRTLSREALEAVVRGTYSHSKLEQARAAAVRVAAAMPEVRW